jgi:glycolate oxidase
LTEDPTSASNFQPPLVSISPNSQITGTRAVITSPKELHPYDSDAPTNFRTIPLAVFLPSSTTEVQAILRLRHRERIPFVAPGSSTGMSGGALLVENGIVISLARMNRTLEVDPPAA